MHDTFYRRCFQLAIAALLAYGVYLVLAPLLRMLLAAVVLAFMLFPVHERLTRALRGRRVLSAAVITALTPFLVLAPLTAVGVAFAEQVAKLVAYLRGVSFLSTSQFLDHAEGYPLVGPAVSWSREHATVSVTQVQGWLTEGLQGLLKTAAATGGQVALGVFGTLLGFFMMLFVLFFLLRDGRDMTAGLVPLIPVERRRREQLLKYLGDVTRAVVFGSVATAVLNGIMVGAGFAFVGLPAAVVFGVIGLVASFLPGGSALVLAPAMLYLAADDRWGAAAFMAGWLGVLTVVENILRPLLTARHAEVSTLALFIGAIGGAAAFGILGLVIGPVLLSFVVALARFAQQPRPADA